MPDTPNVLRTNYVPTDRHEMSGETLNKQNDLINRAAAHRTQQFGTTSAFNIDVPAPPFTMGIATIVSAGETGSVEDGEYQAPLASEHKYLARFRYYDWALQIWNEADDLIQIDAGAYYERLLTDVSKSPAGTPGMGAIPTFGIGDNVPAYWDRMRNWLIPVQGAFEQFPHAGFYTGTSVVVNEDAAANSAVFDAYIEVNRPGIEVGDAWTVIGGVSVGLPTIEMDGTWYESRMGFATLNAPHGTRVRVRMTRGPTQFAQVSLSFGRIKFTAEARRGARSFCSPGFFDSYAGGQLIEDWFIETSAPGRWKDSPAFELLGQGGAYIVRFIDPGDEWIVRIDLELLIQITSDNFSSSGSKSSSSSSSSSSTSSSSTRSSQSTSSASTQSSSSHSRTSSSTSATISTSSSSQSVSVSSSSGYDCTRVVTCVSWDEAQCELVVTYGELCLPKFAGVKFNADVDGPSNC